MSRSATLGTIAALLALSACAKPTGPTSPLVETVGILLFDNESNDVNASDIMQRLVYLAMKDSSYKVLDVNLVNEKLNQAGIVDGGQLAAVDPVKVGKDLGVQALLFGNVESFNYTNIGFYLQRKVNLELKMIDVSTGQTLWENSGSAATRQFAGNLKEAKAAFVGGLADQMVDKVFKTPLEEEARQATIAALRTLPGYRFTAFAVDTATPKPAAAGAKGVLKNLIKK